MNHGKSKGEGFCSLFQELGGEDKISLLTVALISSAKSFIGLLEFANIKMFNLQRKLKHSPPKFPQNSPPNLIMY